MPLCFFYDLRRGWGGVNHPQTAVNRLDHVVPQPWGLLMFQCKILLKECKETRGKEELSLYVCYLRVSPYLGVELRNVALNV